MKVLGEKTVGMLEKAFGFIKTLVTEGPAAAWKEIVAAIGSLWDMVIGGIKDWAVTKIVTAAITKLATMFNPAGAIIQAIIATYNTVAFFIERIKQILSFVEAVVDSIANVANGKIDAAANWIEKAMARSIPVLLGFLARLIGLGNVSDAVKKVITAIQQKVDKGIDFVIDWVVKQAKALFGGKGDKNDADPKWGAAVAGVSSDVDAMPETERNEEGFTKRLSGWKSQWQFTDLKLIQKDGDLIIEGSMSPPKPVKAVKKDKADVKDLDGETELLVKRGGGWIVGELEPQPNGVNQQKKEIQYTVVFPSAGKVKVKAAFSEYGKTIKKYVPGEESYMSPDKLATENKKDVWGSFEVAKKVLNYRARDDNDQSRNPSGMQWHHIHENKANPAGPNSVDNLALTSRANNAEFNTWFMQPQYEIKTSAFGIGYLESTGPKALRTYLKGKGDADLWRKWGYGCLVRHNITVVQERTSVGKGKWRTIPG